MAITFDTKYPTALKNAAWQKSKSLKDKSKAKSGLGELLTVAEKDWRKLEFDLLIAAKQNLTGKNLAQLQAARKEADDYLKGPIVTKAIASLEAAASKAKSTGKNTSLSATAAKAAAALSGALLAQAKLLHAIKLNDFQEGVARAGQTVTQMEHDHTEALKSMDTIRDALKSSKDTQTWQESDVGTVIANAVNITKTLADETDDKNWRDNHERWKRLQISYAATDRRVHSLPHSRVAEEIETFADLMQGALGGMWH